MIIGIDLGHTIRGGVGYGAVGIKSETGLNRPLGNKVINKLRQLGHTAINCTVDEGSNSLSQICANANRQYIDLFVSIHFNCGGGQGVEVLTYDSNSSTANTYAKKICEEISKLGFRNRGVKYRPDLYVLNSTKAEALLIEVAFIDSQYDMNLYNEEKVANAIVYALTGQNVQEIKPTNKVEPKYYLETSYINPESYANSVTNFFNSKDIKFQLKQDGKGVFIQTMHMELSRCKSIAYNFTCEVDIMAYIWREDKITDTYGNISYTDRVFVQ